MIRLRPAKGEVPQRVFDVAPGSGFQTEDGTIIDWLREVVWWDAATGTYRTSSRRGCQEVFFCRRPGLPERRKM